MSWFKHAWKSIKSISHSPILKSVVGVTCLVFPAVGLPAAAALVAANKAIDLSEHTDAAVRAKGQQLLANTQQAAKAGHVDAQRALRVLSIVQAHRRGHPKARAWVKNILDKHNARQTAARRCAAKYRVHPRSGRLVHA